MKHLIFILAAVVGLHSGSAAAPNVTISKAIDLSNEFLKDSNVDSTNYHISWAMLVYLPAETWNIRYALDTPIPGKDNYFLSALGRMEPVNF